MYEIFARFNEYNDNDHPDCDNSDCDICGFDDKHSFLKAEFILVPDNGTGAPKSKTLAKLWSTRHKESSRLNELTSILSEKAGVRGPWSSTGDDGVLSLAKWWFESCKSTHKCQSKALAAKYRPARLMDLDPLHLSGSHWQLIESTNDSPAVPYVTLSHRWGNPEPLKLQADTRAQLISDMPVDDLAGLYKEVIGVVRRLGMRFLWVDSICILQDNHLDIQAEAVKMAEVYSSAICNISALTAQSQSLFSFREHAIVDPLAKLLPEKDYRLGATYRIGQDGNSSWEQGVVNAPLSRRGWVLQEQLLARCTLYFGSKQLFWQCEDATIAEDSLADRVPGIMFPPSLGETPVRKDVKDLSYAADTESRDRRGFTDFLGRFRYDPHYWPQMVENYCSRALTNKTDKLLAISGIAKVEAELRKDDYLAGLWRKELPFALLWEMSGDTEGTTPEQYRAPSWSWAAVDGPVKYYNNLMSADDEPDIAAAQVLSASTDTSTSNGYGVVRRGTIRLRGYTMPLSKSAGSTEWKWPMSETLGPNRPSNRISSCRVVFDTGPQDRTDSALEFTVLVITAAHDKWFPAARGLLLVPVIDGQLGVFQRVGTFEISGKRSLLHGGQTPFSLRESEDEDFPLLSDSTGTSPCVDDLAASQTVVEIV